MYQPNVLYNFSHKEVDLLSGRVSHKVVTCPIKPVILYVLTRLVCRFSIRYSLVQFRIIFFLQPDEAIKRVCVWWGGTVELPCLVGGKNENNEKNSNWKYGTAILISLNSNSRSRKNRRFDKMTRQGRKEIYKKLV